MLSNKPKTYVFEVRSDIRTAASLHRYFLSKGINIASRSDLGATSLETLMEILISNKMAERFESSSDALDYLRSFGINKGKEKRGLKELAEQIQIEEGVVEYQTNQVESFSPEDIMRRAEALYNE